LTFYIALNSDRDEKTKLHSRQLMSVTHNQWTLDTLVLLKHKTQLHRNSPTCQRRGRRATQCTTTTAYSQSQWSCL